MLSIHIKMFMLLKMVMFQSIFYSKIILLLAIFINGVLNINYTDILIKNIFQQITHYLLSLFFSYQEVKDGMKMFNQ